MKAYFDNGKIRLEINGVEHGIDGSMCDTLVNQLLTARHLEMGAVTPRPWKELGRSKRNPTGDGRIAAFEVPELNLVAVLQTPNGGPDDECDKLRSQIVSVHNWTIIHL